MSSDKSDDVRTISVAWDTDEDHPRRLFRLDAQCLLALGGVEDEEGCGSCLLRVDLPQAKSDNAPEASSSQVIRIWSDEVITALAVSDDGKRVAVGFDDGGLQVYAYDNQDNNLQQVHPFCSKPVPGEICFAGPFQQGAMRHLAFQPGTYWLAVASEEGVQLLDATSESSIAVLSSSTNNLMQLAHEHHDNGGIRSVLFWSNDNANKKQQAQYLSTLAMDGRHCLWNVKNNDKEQKSSAPTISLQHREQSMAITRRDVGFIMGSDAWDSSCRMAATTACQGILGLPGEPVLQLRTILDPNGQYVQNNIMMDNTPSTTTPQQGHVESIVVVAAHPRHSQYWATAGRDGRIVLWKIGRDADGQPQAKFIRRLAELDSAATDLLWVSDGGDWSLYAPSANGQLSVVPNVAIGNSSSKPASKPVEASNTKKPSTVSSTKSNLNDDEPAESAAPKPYSHAAKANKKASHALSDDSESDSDDDDGALETQPPPRSIQAATSEKTKAATDNNSDDEMDEENKHDEKTAPNNSDKPTAAAAAASSPSPKRTATDDNVESDGEDDAFDGAASPSPKRLSKQATTDDKVESDDDDTVDKDDDDKPIQPKEKEATATSTSSASPHRLHKLSKTSDADKKNDSDDDDDDIDFGTPDADAKERPKNQFVDDEADDDESLGAPTSSPAGTATTSPAAAAARTSSGADNDVLMMQDDDDDFGGGHDDDDEFMSEGPYGRSAGVAAAPVRALPPPQPAFGPASTPLDLSRRFLCWNQIGSITWNNDADSNNRSVVDIQFTAAAFRRPVSFTDNLGFILGSLGDDGGIFCTDTADDEDDDDDHADDDDDVTDVVAGFRMKATKAALRKTKNKTGAATGSTVYFHRFESIGNGRDKDWYLTLPDGERAVGCATGQGWAAVMTSRRFLRLFSSGGNQDKVIWLYGEPVTMAGSARFVAVFYHESAPLEDGTQKLGYLLYDAVANFTVARGTASCISAGGSLTWAGFDNEGSLLAMDSKGMLSMLVGSTSTAAPDNAATDGAVMWDWVPMLDTVGLRKSSDDSHWPIAVVDGKLVCVPLKGGTKYPDAIRRPVTTALSLRMPLARGNLAKGNAMEELSLRANIALNQKRVIHDVTFDGPPDDVDEDFEKEYTALSAQVDKVTLKMFASTIQANKLDRAFDLVDRLHLEKSFDLAMVLADRHRKLVDMIEDAKINKFGGDQDEDDEFDETPTYEEEDDRHAPRITPDGSSRKSKRPFEQDVGVRKVRSKVY